MAEAEERFLSPPPTEFKRMLSWQLSQPRMVAVRKRKAKRERKLGWEGEGVEDEGGSGCGLDSPVDDFEEGVYYVVNSEGEEEAYYSAPESPLDSEDETTIGLDDSATVVSGWSGHGGQASVDLPEQVRKPGARSKKHKKKAKYLAKCAQTEFFQPLCQLVENQLSLEVGHLDVSSHAEVPSLVELTIRKIQTEALVQQDTSNIPFLVHSLLGHDRELRCTVSSHVRWLERLLAAYESECHEQKRNQSLERERGYGLAYTPRQLWPDSIQLSDFPQVFDGLHCALPEPRHPHTIDPYQSEVRREQRMRPLLHFVNYLFPVFTAKKGAGEYSGSTPLTPSQLAAVAYINKFVKTRYKELCSEYDEFLKLWPGYVYWARGQLKLAADAFTAAISSLKHPTDQAIALNELGRMFLQFGDRSTACRYFRQSTELPVAIKSPNLTYVFSAELAQPSAFALTAAAWDCGHLDTSAARVAARSWHTVLRQAHSLSSGIWYLHMAACESRMFVHAGKPVDGDINRGDPAHQWLQQCDELVGSLTSRFSILHYHASLLQAMMNKAATSSREFRNFENVYVGFRQWADGIVPGHLFTSHIPRYQQPSPWQPLLDMLTKQSLNHAPVMPLQWRLRLLHPAYPYIKSDDFHHVADHGSLTIGLRLTGKGHLTADIHTDLPPMRCVLIDPYNGSLVFSRKASLQHHSTTTYGSPPHLDCFALPWPLRLIDTDDYVVELTLLSTPDLEVSTPVECNYGAVLHRYGPQGAHHQVDLRRAIRRQLRESLLELARDQGLEGKESLLDKLLELGYHVDIQSLRSNEPTRKYKRQSKSRKGKSKGATVVPRKIRNRAVRSFSLRLSHHAVYGEGTVMMSFYLDPTPPVSHHPQAPYWGQALVFVNCSSSELFLCPRVYCVADGKGFCHLYPCPRNTALYQDRHYKHVKYAIAGRSEAMENRVDDHWQLVVDDQGDVVYEKSLRLWEGRSITSARHKHAIEAHEMMAKFSLGHRVFKTDMLTPTAYQVHSYSPFLEDAGDDMEVVDSVLFVVPEPPTVAPVPGVVFVHTTTGLCLLHPGSLEPLEILGLQDSSSGQQQTTGVEDQNSHIQFKGAEIVFKIVKVYDVEGCLEREGEMEGRTEAPQQETGRLESQEQGQGEKEGEVRRKCLATFDYGSCRVAFTLNNRLIILRVPHWAVSVVAELDVLVPGKVTEIHPMGKFGYMLSVTQFPDQFREEVYWLSETGRLLGMLPCLGEGPRSFTSATLPPRPKAVAPPTSPMAVGGREEEEGGLHVFFSDGQGGICCIRPGVG